MNTKIQDCEKCGKTFKSRTEAQLKHNKMVHSEIEKALDLRN